MVRMGEKEKGGAMEFQGWALVVRVKGMAKSGRVKNV